ncbi:hypothetical protein ACE38W_18980 [Chitinophaga sp. Hz27]|uniref:hypothetical protein n=1 Tax=Chitinophaga sp. Hz27 TaxID=3347169 RepID=UPI0035D99953
MKICTSILCLSMAIAMVLSGCDTMSIPVGIKKRKHQIIPSMAFVEAVKRYRLEHKVFPNDLWNLENESDKNRQAFKSMKDLGYYDMRISYMYLDSMVIDFYHKAVYVQKIGKTSIPFTITGKFMFSMGKDSSFFYQQKLD